jgi:hypothetical protein
MSTQGIAVPFEMLRLPRLHLFLWNRPAEVLCWTWGFVIGSEST